MDDKLESCQVRFMPAELRLIERMVKNNERKYENRSHFIRCAAARLAAEHLREEALAIMGEDAAKRSPKAVDDVVDMLRRKYCFAWEGTL